MPQDFDAEAWAALSALLDEVLRLPVDERPAWLEALAADQGAENTAFLNSPAVVRAIEEAAQATRASGTSPAPAQQLGPYRLLKLVGEGGMGEVWLAEQTAPVQRLVALKLIKLGMDTRQIIARFEAERQALAVMDHPAIAKVFDAGETPSGRPYFVMEFVKGEPITAYCDRERLSTTERIELFLKVCDGVQHAHQKSMMGLANTYQSEGRYPEAEKLLQEVLETRRRVLGPENPDTVDSEYGLGGIAAGAGYSGALRIAIPVLPNALSS